MYIHGHVYIYYLLVLIMLSEIQMQNLESRHKNELTTHFRGQERELEQLWTSYEKELERLRSKLKQEADQKVHAWHNMYMYIWVIGVYTCI